MKTFFCTPASAEDPKLGCPRDARRNTPGQPLHTVFIHAKKLAARRNDSCQLTSNLKLLETVIWKVGDKEQPSNPAMMAPRYGVDPLNSPLRRYAVLTCKQATAE